MPATNGRGGNSKQRNGSKSEDASKLIRENMKCPVCLEVLLPPIYQCETGHNICYLCVDEVSECPLCKSDYGDTRNYFAEELVNSMTFPCKYEEYGCHKTFLGSQLKEHQENCECQPYRCPELACQEVVGIHQMAKHLDKHGFKVMKGDVHHASLEILDDHFDRKTEYNPWRISAFNAEFYTVSTRSREGFWHFWTYGLGLQKDLRKFSYEIILFSDEKQFMYRGVVQSLRTSPEDIMKGGTCLITSDSVVKSLRKNGRIKCQVYIIQGKNWDNARSQVNTVQKGKAKAQNNNPTKGKRLISSTATFSCPNSQSSPLVPKVNKSKSILNSLIKASNLNILKKESCTSGSNSRCNSATNKLSLGAGKAKTCKICKKRSRSRSTLSMSRKLLTVSDAEHSFVEKVKETLRCPGCNDVIAPPVFQCLIGHNVCHKCRSARHDCPLCRAPLGESRNFFAEELLYKTFQRCLYAKHGCKVCLPSSQMRSHEMVCDFAPFECPFNVCRALLSADDMFEHLQTHQITVVEKELKGDFPVPRNAPTVPVCNIPNILKIDKIPFYPIIVRDTDGNWLFYVITHNSVAYRYELMIKKQHKTLAFQGPILSLRTNHTQVKLKGLALTVSEKSIKCFKANDKISYHIKISKVNATEGSAKSSFSAPMSWVLTPKSGEVVSKAELFANQKTSVSPEEESEEDDTHSIPNHTTTDTVYFSESDLDSIESENEISSIDDQELVISISNVKDQTCESESDSNVRLRPIISKSLAELKQKNEPAPQCTLISIPTEETKETSTSKSVAKEDAVAAKSSGANSSAKSSVTTSAAKPTITNSSAKPQKSGTSIKSLKLNPSPNMNCSTSTPKAGRSRSCLSSTAGSSVETDSCDLNNNVKQLRQLNDRCVRNLGKKKAKDSPPVTPVEPVATKREKVEITASTSLSVQGLKPPPEEISRDLLTSPIKLEKILKHGKRCRSVSGHRVRMSDDVICCGGATGAEVSSDSSCGSTQAKYRCRGPSSKSQMNINGSISANKVASLPTAFSKHVLSTEVRRELEIPKPISPKRKKEGTEFGQLQKAIEMNENDDLFEEVDVFTAKSLSGISDVVISGGFNVVNSVISLFTTSPEKAEEASEENSG